MVIIPVDTLSSPVYIFVELLIRGPIFTVLAAAPIFKVVATVLNRFWVVCDPTTFGLLIVNEPDVEPIVIEVAALPIFSVVAFVSNNVAVPLCAVLIIPFETLNGPFSDVLPVLSTVNLPLFKFIAPSAENINLPLFKFIAPSDENINLLLHTLSVPVADPIFTAVAAPPICNILVCEVLNKYWVDCDPTTFGLLIVTFLVEPFPPIFISATPPIFNVVVVELLNKSCVDWPPYITGLLIVNEFVRAEVEPIVIAVAWPPIFSVVAFVSNNKAVPGCVVLIIPVVTLSDPSINASFFT